MDEIDERNDADDLDDDDEEDGEEKKFEAEPDHFQSNETKD